jgi:hypothetical protein
MNKELEISWKGVVVAQSRYYLGNCLGRLNNTTEDISQKYSVNISGNNRIFEDLPGTSPRTTLAWARWHMATPTSTTIKMHFMMSTPPLRSMRHPSHNHAFIAQKVSDGAVCSEAPAVTLPPPGLIEPYTEFWAPLETDWFGVAHGTAPGSHRRLQAQFT